MDFDFDPLSQPHERFEVKSKCTGPHSACLCKQERLDALERERVIEVAALRTTQQRFDAAVVEVIGVYRDLRKLLRKGIKERLKLVHERMLDLGESVGVSRLSVDNLWKG